MSNTGAPEQTTAGWPGRRPEAVPMSQIDHSTNPHRFEASHTGYTGYFPEELPARPGPPPQAEVPTKKRWKSYFIFSLSSYSIIHTPDGAARLRHLAMITILLLRTAMSGLSILAAVIKGSVPGIIIYSLLAILTFWFTATCLAIIGDAEGDKYIKRIAIKRWHFDTFLGFCVIIHAVLIVLFFFGLSGWGLELTSIGMWLAILAVSWVAGWQPELPTYQRRWAS